MKKRASYTRMTSKEFAVHFEKKLDAMVRRMAIIRRIVEGEAEIAKIQVRGYKVRAYTVKSHVRYVTRRR